MPTHQLQSGSIGLLTSQESAKKGEGNLLQETSGKHGRSSAGIENACSKLLENWLTSCIHWMSSHHKVFFFDLRTKMRGKKKTYFPTEKWWLHADM